MTHVSRVRKIGPLVRLRRHSSEFNVSFRYPCLPSVMAHSRSSFSLGNEDMTHRFLPQSLNALMSSKVSRFVAAGRNAEKASSSQSWLKNLSLVSRAAAGSKARHVVTSQISSANSISSSLRFESCPIMRTYSSYVDCEISSESAATNLSRKISTESGTAAITFRSNPVSLQKKSSSRKFLRPFSVHTRSSLEN